ITNLTFFSTCGTLLPPDNLHNHWLRLENKQNRSVLMSVRTGSNRMVQKGYKDGQIEILVKYFVYRDDTNSQTYIANLHP
ncbi:MAG: hypothetical protein VXW88_05565, partial [Pseudomonadota bacterium]|nr:hypothetical protein [Pseudomonadota bacterium]